MGVERGGWSEMGWIGAGGDGCMVGWHGALAFLTVSSGAENMHSTRGLGVGWRWNGGGAGWVGGYVVGWLGADGDGCVVGWVGPLRF